MIIDIGIITHYDVHNHGALLQLNALVKTLQREEHHDYVRHNAL